VEYVDFDEMSLYVTDSSIFILIFTLLHVIKKNRNNVLTALKPRIGFNTQHLKLGLCVCLHISCFYWLLFAIKGD